MSYKNFRYLPFSGEALKSILANGFLGESTFTASPSSYLPKHKGNIVGILSNIFSKIFPSAHAAPSSTTPAAAPSQVSPATPTAVTATTPTPIAEVDVEKLLTDLAQKSPEKLNWRTSIVDLMKLLNIDSSLAARKDLAKELNYAGDMSDSASMNIWLHRQVMNKVAANGGKVPADLKD